MIDSRNFAGELNHWCQPVCRVARASASATLQTSQALSSIAMDLQRKRRDPGNGSRDISDELAHRLSKGSGRSPAMAPNNLQASPGLGFRESPDELRQQLQASSKQVQSLVPEGLQNHLFVNLKEAVASRTEPLVRRSKFNSSKSREPEGIRVTLKELSCIVNIMEIVVPTCRGSPEPCSSMGERPPSSRPIVGRES